MSDFYKSCGAKIPLFIGSEHMEHPERFWKNKVQCSKCKDIIESIHVHDFKYCKCKSIFVDGGNDYWRVGFDEPHDVVRIYERLK